MKKYYDIDGYQSSQPSQYLPPQGKTMEYVIQKWIYDKPLIPLPDCVRGAMSEWASIQTADLQRQLIKKDEAIRELVEGLKETVRCCGVFKDNMIDVDVTLEEHCNQIKNAQSLIQKHKQ